MHGAQAEAERLQLELKEMKTSMDEVKMEPVLLYLSHFMLRAFSIVVFDFVF